MAGVGRLVLLHILMALMLTVTVWLTVNQIIKRKPLNWDSDNDEMPDGWEVRYSLDPLNPADAGIDSDSDGYSNIIEYLHGSIPNDSESIPSPIVFFIPSEVDNIQDAINWSVDGDIIEIDGGVYTGVLDFDGKAIAVRSVDPNDWDVVQDTIIDANTALTAVKFDSGEDNNSVLCGVTIRNATYGITCDNSSSPLIAKCFIEDCDSYGIYVPSGSPLVMANIIADNDGTAIYSSSSTPPTVLSNWIYGNNKGIEIVNATAAALLRNNTIVDQVAAGIEVTSSVAPGSQQ